jgi:hypothetical protein
MHVHACEHVEAQIDGWLMEERNIFVSLLRSTDLRIALEMGAPLVAQAAERYIEHTGHWDGQDRKAERGLMQYLTRALVRTSPLGRYTAVGLAKWDTAGAGLAQVPDLTAARSALSYDPAMLMYALGGLLVVAGDIVDGWVTVNTTVVVNGDRVEFVVGREGRLRRLSASLSPATTALLTLAGLGPLPTEVLTVQLAAVFDRPVQDAAKAVRAGLSTGLLMPAAFDREQNGDLLADVRARLGTGPDSLVWELEEALAAVDRSEEPAARRAALRALAQLETRLAEATLRPAHLQVNEDLHLPPSRLDPADHEAALDDLAAVLDFSSLYDPMHELRALLTRAAVELIGEGGDRLLTDCAYALVSTVYERWATLDPQNAEQRGTSDGALAALLRVRGEVTSELLDEIERSGETDEIEWRPNRLRDFGSLLPERFRRTPEAYAALLQPIEGSRLVLNAIYSGHGTLFARFLAHDAAVGGNALARQRSRLEGRWGTDGVPLAEDRGLHRLGVNAHAAILPRAVQAADWVRMRLRHDAERDELSVLDAEGRQVRPMALGTAWQEALPPTVRLAAWLTASGRTPPDAIAEAVRRRQGTRPAKTISIPRIGTPRLLISRRRWLPGENMPGADAALSTGELLLALTRWRAEHGVSEEVILKTPLPERLDTSEAGLKDTLEERRREKPQYVDLASALHARLLPRLLSRRGQGYVEEAIPSLREGAHALEWLVELERSPGQSFSARRPAPEPSA